MADIQYSYSISELERGNDVVFTDSGASTLVDSQPEVNERYRRLPLVEVVVDSISEVADASTNTTHCALVAQGMSHCTGGWPLSVDPTEAESQWKYTEKIEREESFIGAMTVLGPGVVKLLRENNTLDLYEKYLFADSLHETYYQSSDVPSLKLSNVLSGTGEVTGSSWSPFNSFRLAVAHTGNTLLPGMVWDINETQKPIARLLPNKESLTAIAYSVKDLNIVAGGSADGILYCWDTRQGARSADHSSVENSHREAIHAVKWMTAKSGEALSASLDGTVKVWDMRKLNTPLANNLLSLHHDGADDGMMDELFGAVALDYDPLAGGPGCFLVGTQEGYILDCERSDGIMQVIDMYSAHHGPVYSVQRSSTHPSLMLSAGDWRCSLWYDSCPTPLWSTPYSDSYVTSAVWQHKRSSLFLRSMVNGCIEAWDLHYKQVAPTLSYRISNYALTHLALHSDGGLLTVGDTSGSVHVVQLEGTLVEDKPEYHSWLDLIVKEGGHQTKQVSPIQMGVANKTPSMFMFTSRGGSSPKNSGGAGSQARISQFRGSRAFLKKQSGISNKNQQNDTTVVSRPTDNILENYLAQVKQSMAEASSLQTLGNAVDEM